MKILLTHGYFLCQDEIEQKILKPYPPLGLLYVSAYLNEKSITHQVFDTTFSTIDDWWSNLLKEKPNLIAFYVNLMTKVRVIELINRIKKEPSLTAMKIVLGGPDLTYNQENYLAAGADYLIVGEGEVTMLELVNTLSDNGDISNITGLTYLENNSIKKNPPRAKLKDLDLIPNPNRAAVPIQKYLDCWKNAHGQSALNVSTQRGCPYTCKWCSTAVYGQSYRRKSPEKVVEELLLLKETYQPDTFWFVDDVFTVSHKWLRGFNDAIKATGLEIQYECITRAERMNDEVIQLLKESGCFRVWIGAESGSQKIIDAMDRRVDVNQVRDQLIATKKAGIETGTFIMVGYPGETYEDILLTAEYLEKALPNHFTITKSYPIKGTQLYTEIESKITVKPDWNTTTDRQINFERKYSDAFYRYAIRYIYNRVNLKKQKLNNSVKIKVRIKLFISSIMLRILAK